MGDFIGKLLIIGLMGGIGSGKSKVASLFQDFGAEVLNADLLVHEILKLPEVKRKITQKWGEHLLAGGEIDRRALTAIVFPEQKAFSEDLKYLQTIIHPLVREKIEARLDQIGHRSQVAVIDAPLLYEGGLYKKCDILIFVDAPLNVRQARVVQERGWSSHELAIRERFQIALEEKRRIADYVVLNGGSEEETRKQVQSIWHSLFSN